MEQKLSPGLKLLNLQKLSKQPVLGSSKTFFLQK